MADPNDTAPQPDDDPAGPPPRCIACGDPMPHACPDCLEYARELARPWAESPAPQPDLDALAAGMSYEPDLMTRDPVRFAAAARRYLDSAVAPVARQLAEARAEVERLRSNVGRPAASLTRSIHELVNACDELEQERDAALARAEAAERQRDELRAEHHEQDRLLARAIGMAQGYLGRDHVLWSTDEWKALVALLPPEPPGE